MEALRLAPENRELRRLLVRVKEECKEQAKLENSGSVVAANEINKQDIPDIVPSMSNNNTLRREETAL